MSLRDGQCVRSRETEKPSRMAIAWILAKIILESSREKKRQKNVIPASYRRILQHSRQAPKIQLGNLEALQTWRPIAP